MKIKASISIFLLCTSIVLAFAAPKRELWEYWKKSNESNYAQIDHSMWTYLLEKYVQENKSEVNLINYKAFTAEDINNVLVYLDYLQSITITNYPRPEQMAYWINLYNAYTLKTILKYYPVKSIRKINISPGTFSIGPWDKNELVVEGHIMSLNDIEHRILRPIWSDDRIHYAVNCASIGCPDLLTEAYTSDKLEAQLDYARHEHINSERGVSVNRRGDLVVSSLYKWYLEDFAVDTEGLVAYLLKYLDEGDTKSRVAQWDVEKNKIKYVYDWDINELK